MANFIPLQWPAAQLGYFHSALPQPACRMGNEPDLWEDQPGTRLTRPHLLGHSTSTDGRKPSSCATVISLNCTATPQGTSNSFVVREEKPEVQSLASITAILQTRDTQDWGILGLEIQKKNCFAWMLKASVVLKVSTANICFTWNLMRAIWRISHIICLSQLQNSFPNTGR